MASFSTRSVREYDDCLGRSWNLARGCPSSASGLETASMEDVALVLSDSSLCVVRKMRRRRRMTRATTYTTRKSNGHRGE